MEYHKIEIYAYAFCGVGVFLYAKRPYSNGYERNRYSGTNQIFDDLTSQNESSD